MAALGIALAAISVEAGPARAAAPDFLLRIPAESIASGSGADQLNNPRGMTTDRTNGHIFIGDLNNFRISEYTAWGEFVKAWGWDVAPGPVDEEQEIRVRAASGRFKLSFGASTTADLDFDASASEVEAALNGLPSISAGGGGISVESGPGGANSGRPYVVRFDDGPLAASDVAQLVVSDGTTPLAGGAPFSGAAITTRADGTPDGTGLESCTAESGCQAGDPGDGPGQVNSPSGLAVDATGNVYVYERPLGVPTARVQKFDPAGHFELMWGGDVNKTTGADVCTAADISGGDTCGAGLFGSTDGWFSNSSIGSYLTYNRTTDTIFVGDVDRIQEFETDGSFKGKIDFTTAPLDGRAVEALAADPSSGDLYMALVSNPPTVETVYRLDSSTGTILDELAAVYPSTIAVDAAGSVYVALKVFGDNNDDTINSQREVLGFEADGDPIPGMEPGDGFAAPLEASHSLNGIATNVLGPGSDEPGDLYVDYFSGGPISYANAYGPSPIAFEDPPPVPPTIAEQFAASVDTDAAVVRAKINPHFWTDTTYFVQYGTAACPESSWIGSACSQAPVSPALLGTKSIDAPLTTAGVLLSGLQPGTTYHYRFVAQSIGGGPVFGSARAFTTFRLVGDRPCANAGFRLGPAAGLPDCRAYELVSPVDKNNADVMARLDNFGYPASLEQSTDSGERLTYSAGTPFVDPEGGPYTSQYLAQRTEVGWASEGLSPPRTRLQPINELLRALQSEFRIFSADLCNAWLKTIYDPPLAAGAVAGLPNLYRRRNCGGSGEPFEALTAAARSDHPDPDVYDTLQPMGASADGSRAIFVAPDDLPGTAAPENADDHLQLYEHDEQDGLRFVCILPSGNASKRPCYAGTADEDRGGPNHVGSFQGAISADGERIFWTEALGTDKFGPGKLFVRFREEPTSREVSGKVSKPDPARFWGAAADGSRAIFAFEAGAEADKLFSFDVDAGLPMLIASQLEGVMGISEDARSVYFASTKALTGEEENSEGEKAQEGAHNLYLWQEAAGGAQLSFVARLAIDDIERFSSIQKDPFRRTSRVSPDGQHALFMSTAPLTGYDNTDAVSDQPDAEVFLYDAREGELRCVSCNPSGARPTGRQLSTTGLVPAGLNFWFAAKVPTWQWPTYASRALSDDGRRAFFESLEALVPRDSNGQQDVYQWEEAGAGTCTSDDPTFSAEAAGCIDLISSGESPREAVFVDAGANGNDVFFSTLSSLIGADYGLVDIYDARVGGGFPEAEPPSECEGEACQSPPAPPQAPTPSSASIEGPGNVPQTKPKPRCPKGKRRVVRRGKARCVKSRKGARRSGRAAR